MPTFTCDKCKKDFNDKSHYNRHLARKTPCVKDKTDINNLSKNELLVKAGELGINNVKSKTNAEIITLINKQLIVISGVKYEEANKKYNVIDLFCGCGGSSKGLHDAGFNIIAAIDVWDKAVESYNQNFTHKAYCHDLTTFEPKNFDELYNKDKLEIDMIIGGPPCQSFSTAGKRDVNDPRNSLFLEFIKYLNYFNPKSFIMENVMGILSKTTATNENIIDIIMSYLNQNYNCLINTLYASDFEVPQNRRRVIIIGIRKNLNILPTEPIKIIKTPSDRLPIEKFLEPKDKIDKSYYLSTNEIQYINNKNLNGIFKVKILDFDKPCNTIVASYGNNNYASIIKYNEYELRRLTILELKRMQSFPDDYKINGSNKDIMRQIGNAIPCKFAYHLGKHMINILNKC